MEGLQRGGGGVREDFPTSLARLGLTDKGRMNCLFLTATLLR